MGGLVADGNRVAGGGLGLPLVVGLVADGNRVAGGGLRLPLMGGMVAAGNRVAGGGVGLPLMGELLQATANSTAAIAMMAAAIGARWGLRRQFIIVVLRCGCTARFASWPGFVGLMLARCGVHPSKAGPESQRCPQIELDKLA